MGIDLTTPALSTPTNGLSIEVTQVQVRDILQQLLDEPNASEATLAAVRDTLIQHRDNFVAEDFAKETTLQSRATEATLAAARDKLLTMAGANQYQATEDFYDIECAFSRMFASGAKITTSALSPNASLTLSNPPNSGKELIIRRWSMYADTNADIMYYFNAVSAGTIRTAFNLNQHDIVPPPAAVAEVRAGSGVLSGGTELAMVSRVGPNAPLFASHMCIHLAPGQAWSIRFIGPGATNMVNMNFEWAEKVI